VGIFKIWATGAIEVDRDESRLAQRLGDAVCRGVTPSDLGEQISRAVDPWVRHDALRLVGLNPAAGLGLASFSFWHGYEADLGRALVHDSHLTATAGSGDHRDDTSRKLLSEHGLGYELRLLLQDSRGVWGSLGLARAKETRPFRQDDLRRAVRLVPALVAALRRYVTTGPLTPAVPTLPAGVIIVGPDHRVRTITTQAGEWLRQMWTPERHRLPDWIALASVERLSIDTRAHLHDPRAWRPVVCAPATTFGRWVTIHAQALDEDGTGDVAVVIQAATGALLVPSFCDWYGITTGERRVLESLSTGQASKQIARHLNLSLGTVNDHLKAVFRKTGAHGRDELLAAMTS
jgi:DNA-binding CsgD family transcriptional regulator